MNKSDFVKAISDKVGFTLKDCGAVVEAFMDVVVDTLKDGNEVVLTGFGKFESKQRNAREGKDPRTGAKLMIKACKVPAFKAGKAFKDGIQ